MKFSHPCNHGCNGTGHLTCNMCKGSGRCKKCAGTGTIPDQGQAGSICAWCWPHGSGICIICEGNGDVICRACGGTGWIEIMEGPWGD